MEALATPPLEPLSAADRRRRAAEIRDRFERIRKRTLALARPRRRPLAADERANLDELAFGPAPVGAHQMVGDVWEWTASDFTPYPGFEVRPYPEYSEVFFGPDDKALRGGSWATRPGVARGTCRNWDDPIRRQTFTGIRCARDE
jgi:formylglycine-generating enzyme required for sulfatase activity